MVGKRHELATTIRSPSPRDVMALRPQYNREQESVTDNGVETARMRTSGGSDDHNIALVNVVMQNHRRFFLGTNNLHQSNVPHRFPLRLQNNEGNQLDAADDGRGQMRIQHVNSECAVPSLFSTTPTVPSLLLSRLGGQGGHDVPRTFHQQRQPLSLEERRSVLLEIIDSALEITADSDEYAGSIHGHDVIQLAGRAPSLANEDFDGDTNHPSSRPRPASENSSQPPQ